MRTSSSIKNITTSVITQLIIALLGFVSRKIFLDSLGTEYLGINGLLTNVLSMLALVESGIGTSITYNLYKPLAEKDEPKIIALVQLYKRAYVILAFIILVLSILLYPFLGNLIKSSGSISYLTIAYFIFVAKNMTYYFNAHKISLITADQKGYIVARINLIFQVLSMIIKIIILIKTHNYLLFLGLELFTYLIQNIYNGKIVNKHYAFIKTKTRYFIEESERKGLTKNVKAMFLHNIGSYAVFGTDNILISSFIGIATVGLYSNYTMIIGQLGTLISPLIGEVGASVGNLIATESKDKNYSVFKISYLINFWVYSVCTIFLYNLLAPFINWWLGEGYLLGKLSLIMILINFYITGLRSSIFTFKIKGGIFVQDKYMPLLGAVVNLVSSIILVNYMGLVGIFIGTTLSTLAVFWLAPILVFKHIFKVSVWLYFIKYSLYIFLTVTACFITTCICNILVDGHSFISLVERGFICLIIPNFIYLAIFYKTDEFQYIKTVLTNIFNGFKLKIISIKQAKA